MVPLQLSVRGKPSAFDISSSNDIIAIASPGCIGFFHINGFGSPKHVIHYEQPQQIRQLKFQRGGQSFIAALRGPSVSLWDSVQSVRPLAGLIGNTGWITDLDWNYGNSNILATTCDAGDVQIIDARDLKNPFQNINFGGILQLPQWCPTNTNVLSVVRNNRFLYLIDTRMFPSDTDVTKFSNVIEFDTNITQTSWGYDASRPSFLVGNSSGSIEWWDMTSNTVQSEVETVYIRDVVLRPPIVDNDSLLLSTPVGRAAVVARPTEDSIEIKLHGYARDGADLERVFQDPKTDTNVYSDGPMMTLARCEENIIGLRWGTPGRLTPAFGGLELLALSESSKLYPIQIRPENVSKYCGIKSARDSGNSIHRGKASKKQNMCHYYTSKYSIKDVKKLEKTAPADPAAMTLSNESDNQENIPIITESKVADEVIVENGYEENKEQDIALIQISNFFSRLQQDISTFRQVCSHPQFSNVLVGSLDRVNRRILIGMTKDMTREFPLRYFDDPKKVDISLLIDFSQSGSNALQPTFSLYPEDIDLEMKHLLLDELSSIAQSFFGGDSIEQSNISEEKIKNFDDIDNNPNAATKEPGLLFQIIETFRNHVLQNWELKYSQDMMKWIQSMDTTKTFDVIPTLLREYSTASQVERGMQKAERTPWPVSSGARFSPRGMLVLFGGASFSNPPDPGTENFRLNNSLIGFKNTSDIVNRERQKSMEKFGDANIAINSFSNRGEVSSPVAQYDASLCVSPTSPTNFISTCVTSNDNKEITGGAGDTNEVHGERDVQPIESFNDTSIPTRQFNYLDFVLKKQKDTENTEKEKLYAALMEIYRNNDVRSVMSLSDGGQIPSLLLSELNYDAKSPDGMRKAISISGRTKRSDSQLSLEKSMSFGSLNERKDGEELDESINMIKTRERQQSKDLISLISQTSLGTGRFNIQDVAGASIHSNIHLSTLINRKITGLSIEKESYEWAIIQVYQVSDYTEQNLGYHYCFGPKSKLEKIDRETILMYSDICRYNATKARQCRASSHIVQSWELLALSIDVLSIPNCSGGLISWNESCLGYPLLFQVIRFLLQSGDIVSLGAVICLFGGSRGLREMLENFPLQPSVTRNQSIDIQKSQSHSSSDFDLGLPLSPDKSHNESMFQQYPMGMNSNGNMHILASTNAASQSYPGIISARRKYSFDPPFDNLDVLENYFEVIILRFSDLLYQWCLFEKATEARKFYNVETMKRLEGRDSQAAKIADTMYTFKTNLSTFEYVEWKCHRCGEIENVDFKMYIHEEKCRSRPPKRTYSCQSENTLFRLSSSLSFAGGQSDYDDCDDIDSRLWCKGCNTYAINCSICDLPVRGVANTCLRCGHGGHPEHMRRWFYDNTDCPTGCGCRCRGLDANTGEDGTSDSTNKFRRVISKNSMVSSAYSGYDYPDMYDMGEPMSENVWDFNDPGNTMVSSYYQNYRYDDDDNTI